jgi:hypothetical protein
MTPEEIKKEIDKVEDSISYTRALYGSFEIGEHEFNDKMTDLETKKKQLEFQLRQSLLS